MPEVDAEPSPQLRQLGEVRRNREPIANPVGSNHPVETLASAGRCGHAQAKIKPTCVRCALQRGQYRFHDCRHEFQPLGSALTSAAWRACRRHVNACCGASPRFGDVRTHRTWDKAFLETPAPLNPQ
jgi:hypothetical protein